MSSPIELQEHVNGTHDKEISGESNITVSSASDVEETSNMTEPPIEPPSNNNRRLSSDDPERLEYEIQGFTILNFHGDEPPIRSWEQYTHLIRAIPISVWVVVLMGLLYMIVQMSFNPQLLLLMNSHNWTTPQNMYPYSLAISVAQLMPLFLNPLFGAWAHFRGWKQVFLIDGAFVLLSTLGMILFSYFDLMAFFISSYDLSYFQLPLRSLRTAYISQTTDAEIRTPALTLLPISLSIGAILGSFVSFLCSTSTSNHQLLTPMILTLWVSMFLLLVILLLTLFAFKPLPITVSRPLSFNTQQIFRQKRIAKRWTFTVTFVFFIQFLLVQFSLGVYQVSFQPILVNLFSYDSTMMSVVSIFISFLSVFAGVGLIFLSTKVSDRILAVGGLSTMILGMIVFSAPPLHQYQVWIGYSIIMNGAPFYTTPMMSIYSKILYGRANGIQIGVLSSAIALGPAIASFLLSPLHNVYGTGWFMMFLLPAVFILSIFAVPPMFRMLDPIRSREFVLIATNVPPPGVEA